MTKYKYSDEEFTKAVKESFSIRAVLKTLGMAEAGGSYKYFRARIKKLNLDISHFTGQGHLKGKNHGWNKKIPIEEILIKNSQYSSTDGLRKRLVKENKLENKCANPVCGITQWYGNKLTLHLDHIDGDNTNNQLSNLRLLCPNCHSQTDTYCGRNKGKNKYGT